MSTSNGVQDDGVIVEQFPPESSQTATVEARSMGRSMGRSLGRSLGTPADDPVTEQIPPPGEQTAAVVAGTAQGAASTQALEAPRVLALHERVPDVSEHDAAGAISGVIRRTSPEFATLVKNENADIVFKDEEGTGADRMMSPRMSARLDALAALVAAEWSGVKLRVTEAWDENLEHRRGSLHYEGRSADLTTSDRDGGKLGRLGGLAVAAGLDWVLYEDASHVHVSVKKETAEAKALATRGRFSHGLAFDTYTPLELRQFWARQTRREHHSLWHSVRDQRFWASLPAARRASLEAAGWKAPRFVGDANSGVDFLAMHRTMIRHTDLYLGLLEKDGKLPAGRFGEVVVRGPARVMSWDPIPWDHADPVWPMPAVPASRSWAAFAKAPLETRGYQRLVRDRFRSMRWLKAQTLDSLGQQIESSIHNWMHMHWSEDEPSASTASSIDVTNDWLGNPFSSAVNSAFWKLHAWIDARIEDWRQVTGSSTATLDRTLASAWSGPIPSAPSALSAVQALAMADGNHASMHVEFEAIADRLLAWTFPLMSVEEFEERFPWTPGEGFPVA